MESQVHENGRQLEQLALQAELLRHRHGRIDAVLRVYVILGVVVAVGALGFLGIDLLDVTLTVSQQLALLAAGSGLLISTLSYTLVSVRQRQDVLRYESLLTSEAATDLIRQWAVFEELGRGVLIESGLNFNKYSPRAILNALVQGGFISSSDSQEVHSALETRNKLVHGPETVSLLSMKTSSAVLRRVNELLQPDSISERNTTSITL